MAKPTGNWLIVGGTGMLANATREISQYANSLTLVSRDPGLLADELGASAHALDWNAPDAMAHVSRIPGTPFDGALIWLHDAACHLARPFENLLKPGARVIRIHGSLSADAAIRAKRDPDPRPDLKRQTVILGYHPDPGAPDGRRWLSDSEISAGALDALASPDRQILIVGTKAGA